MSIEPAGRLQDSLTGAALCWGSVRGTDLFELAELAARFGFPELSVNPAHFRRAGLPGDEVRHRLAEAGVTVGVLDALMSALPGAPDPASVPPNLRESFEFSTQECIDAAVGLGARSINMAHYLAAPAAVPELARAVREVADAAADAGLGICLEFMPDTSIPDLSTALQIVEKVARPNVGVLLDTWHFFRSGGVLGDLEGLEPGQVTEAQLNDRIPPPEGTPYVPMAGRLAPGEGEWPLVEVVQALRRSAPDVVLGVEVFTAERGDPARTVAHLAEATSSVLDRLRP